MNEYEITNFLCIMGLGLERKILGRVYILHIMDISYRDDHV
jgi:hypothetical protein